MEYETIDKLEDDFIIALNMPIAPNFCKVKPDHVFDEDRSVRWNREEAIRVNTEYDAKCKILREERDATISYVTDRIKKYIALNAGCSLQRAELIWNFVYGYYRSDIIELFDKLEEFVNFFADYEAYV